MFGQQRREEASHMQVLESYFKSNVDAAPSIPHCAHKEHRTPISRARHSYPCRRIAGFAKCAYRVFIVAVVVTGLALDCVDWNWPIPNLLLWKFSYYTIQSNSIIGLYYYWGLTMGSASVGAEIEQAGEARMLVPKFPDQDLVDSAPSTASSGAATTISPKVDTTNLTRSAGHGDAQTLMKSCLLIMILITGAVWHLILRGQVDDTHVSWKTLTASHILHTATPALVWLDWLLFDLKGRLRNKNIISFTICPLLYLAFSYTRAFLGGPLYTDHRTGQQFYHWYRFIEAQSPVRIYPWSGVDHLPKLVVLCNCLFIAAAVSLFSFGFIAFDRALHRFQHCKQLGAS